MRMGSQLAGLSVFRNIGFVRLDERLGVQWWSGRCLVSVVGNFIVGFPACLASFLFT